MKPIKKTEEEIRKYKNVRKEKAEGNNFEEI